MIGISINPYFEKWALGFSGCDGGDIGNASEKSVWVCGIEYGGGHRTEELKQIFSNEVSVPCSGYDDWAHNLGYIYNRQVMKILAAIDGRSVSEYKKFAEEEKPFTAGSKGYFKLNLYPLAFKDTSHAHWLDGFLHATGFKNKGEYVSWVKKFRFPVIRNWTAQYAPELILCTGITYQDDFFRAFGDANMKMTKEVIDDRELFYGYNEQGSLIVIIPFMVNRHGLTSNVSIQKFGGRIKALLMHKV